MARLCWIAIVFLQLGSGLAAADSIGHDDREPEIAYGRYIVIADGGAAVIALAGTMSTYHTADFVLAGLTTYAIGGPIVHVAHGNYGRAAGSLGLRVALPVVGLLVGDAIQQLRSGGDPHPWEGWDGPPSPWWLLGTAAGFLAASAIDVEVFAGGMRRRPRRSSLTWTPTARASGQGVAFGLAGSF